MISEFILKNAVRFGSKIALQKGGDRISYAQLAEQINKKVPLISDDLLLNEEDAFNTIITLLAAQLAGKKVVLNTGKELESEEVFLSINSQAFLGILSAGSTGKPKVIWKSNENWESAFGHQSAIFGIDENSKVFVLDALAYSANLNTVLHALWIGATVVFGQLNQAKNWPIQFKNESVTGTFLVPSHLKFLEGYHFPHLRYIVTAGEKLNPKIARNILEHNHSVIITEYYGAAELGHISYHQNEDILLNPLSVGKAFPGVEIMIDDQNISVRSPYVSCEFDGEGSVNDLGYFENDQLILLGRSGRMFNRRGLNIYAQEIETTALTKAEIKEAVLIKKSSTDKLFLFYTTKAGEALASEKLRLFLTEKLQESKIPNFFRQIDEIPHSEAGKVDFKALTKICE